MRSILRRLRAALRLIGVPSRPGTSSSGQLAFATIAEDPAILFRLPRDQAGRLGAQAEGFAACLLRDGTPSPATAHAVIRTVRQFSARERLRGGGPDDMVASALSGATDGLGGLLATLSQEGSQEGARPSQGSLALAVDAVLALGAAGIARLGPERAERLMSAAARQAARLARGEVRSTAPAADEAAVLAVIEQACVSARLLPLPLLSGGTRRERAETLVELWRDAATCAERSRSARLWEDARDGHAFGAVWLMPSILSVVLRDEAERLAGDARSAAAFVVRRGPLIRGSGAAVQAARAVLVACAGSPEETVRPSAVRVPAAPA